MRKTLFSLTFVLALLLSACGQASPTATPSGSTSQGSSGATATPGVQPTVDFQASGPAVCKVDASPFTFPAPVSGPVPFAPITDKDWIRGPETATLTIVEYSDFTCPACASVDPGIRQFLNDYPADARLVYRHFPLGHDKSDIATRAGEAAGKQGKFWEMHDFLFDPATWQSWIGKTPADFETWIVEQAPSLGLDRQQFIADLSSPEIKSRVPAATDAAVAAGLNSTPSLFILLDGKLYFLPQDQIRMYADLQAVLELYKWSKNPKAYECPPMTVNPEKSYTATITTERGDIVMELFARQAPMAVNSFIFLAKNGWFDGVPFHRVLPGFVAQTGDPSGTGVLGPGYKFSNEVTPELRFDQAGRVGLANSGPDTNGSQFFIAYAPLPDLDGKYTVFGQVIKGMDVVNNLRPRNPASDAVLLPGDRILKVTIEEK